MKNLTLSVGLVATALAFLTCSVAQSAFVNISPSQDNSIFSENNNSSGQGPLIVGRTAASGGFSLRRALVQFDIAANIPAGATINSASLDLTQSMRGPGAVLNEVLELRPVSAAWGEGISNGVGLGAAPELNDATWNFRIYATNSWTTAGGDFGGVSGSTLVGTTNGPYTFGSQAGMVADVQNWLSTPASNFGWMLKFANEAPQANARQFGSGESGNSPILRVDFTPVPEPGSLALIGSVLAVASTFRFRRS